MIVKIVWGDPICDDEGLAKKISGEILHQNRWQFSGKKSASKMMRHHRWHTVEAPVVVAPLWVQCTAQWPPNAALGTIYHYNTITITIANTNIKTKTIAWPLFHHQSSPVFPCCSWHHCGIGISFCTGNGLALACYRYWYILVWH